jgi:hypothetical protein
MKRSVEVILTMLGSLVFSILFAVVLLEWAAGCGESWVQADGSKVQGDCMFIGKPIKEWLK